MQTPRVSNTNVSGVTEGALIFASGYPTSSDRSALLSMAITVKNHRHNNATSEASYWSKPLEPTMGHRAP